MKIIKNAKATVSEDGKTVSIVADIADEPFNENIITRVTHGHFNPANTKHARHVQSSNAAVFVRRGALGVAIANDSLVAIGATVEPLTSFAPVLKAGSTPDKLDVVSELPVTYQWQVSDNPTPVADQPHTPPPPAVWADIASQTTATLDESAVASGHWVRLLVKNAVGTTISKAVQKK